MPSANKLSASEIANRLAELNNWSIDQEKLYKHFVFADFRAAFAFMTAVAEVAEQEDHHPEWHNVYNQVRVHLTTHSAQGISNLDFKLAKAMDELARDKVDS